MFSISLVLDRYNTFKSWDDIFLFDMFISCAYTLTNKIMTSLREYVAIRTYMYIKFTNIHNSTHLKIIQRSMVLIKILNIDITKPFSQQKNNIMEFCY